MRERNLPGEVRAWRARIASARRDQLAGEPGTRPIAAPTVEHPNAARAAHDGAALERHDFAQRDVLEVRRERGDHAVAIRSGMHLEHEHETIARVCALRKGGPEIELVRAAVHVDGEGCLLYTSPSPRDR